MLGHKTVVYTDDAALRLFLGTSNPSGKLARWKMMIQQISPEIRYRAGRVNQNADALSCLPLVEADVTIGTADEATEGMAAPVAVVEKQKKRKEFSGSRKEIVEKDKTDANLAEIRKFVVEGVVLDDWRKARYLPLTQGRLRSSTTLCYVEPQLHIVFVWLSQKN